jgi:hypothetical protein
MGGCRAPRPDRFTHGKDTRYPHFTGGWVDLGAALNVSRKSRPHQSSKKIIKLLQLKNLLQASVALLSGK